MIIEIEFKIFYLLFLIIFPPVLVKTGLNKKLGQVVFCIANKIKVLNERILNISKKEIK